MRTSGSSMSIGVRRGAWLLLAWLAACSAVPPSAPAGLICPYAPWYGHAYRHGAVPTREAQQRILAWKASRREAQAPLSPATLVFGGGVDGIGVTSGDPRVYLVFYGSQWRSGGDPRGAAGYLQRLFAGLGTGGEIWSGTMTQYCDGPTVPQGASSCNPADTPHVGYPQGGALAGVWFDTDTPAPASATPAQLAQEAIRAAAHFANSSPAANRYAQYLIVSPSGTHPDGFGLADANFCAWHNYTTSPDGDLAYSNMPYVSDLGSSCGTSFVNPGAAGALDGFSIVGGHEYAETLTDQNPPGGWSTAAGAETGDECAWIASGQGASADVTMGNGVYAMQSTWSNDTGQCEIAHPIR